MKPLRIKCTELSPQLLHSLTVDTSEGSWNPLRLKGRRLEIEFECDNPIFQQFTLGDKIYSSVKILHRYSPELASISKVLDTRFRELLNSLYPEMCAFSGLCRTKKGDFSGCYGPFSSFRLDEKTQYSIVTGRDVKGNVEVVSSTFKELDKKHGGFNVRVSISDLGYFLTGGSVLSCVEEIIYNPEQRDLEWSSYCQRSPGALQAIANDDSLFCVKYTD